MPDITERYISEKNCDQVVAACRFAFKELNLNVEADYCEDGENHYLAKRKNIISFQIPGTLQLQFISLN